MVLFEFVPKAGIGQKVLPGGAGRWKRLMKRRRCLGVQQVFSRRVNTSEPVEPLKINGLWGWARRCLGVLGV
jgi:hypothetical protein